MFCRSLDPRVAIAAETKGGAGGQRHAVREEGHERDRDYAEATEGTHSHHANNWDPHPSITALQISLQRARNTECGVADD